MSRPKLKHLTKWRRIGVTGDFGVAVSSFEDVSLHYAEIKNLETSAEGLHVAVGPELDELIVLLQRVQVEKKA